MCSANGVPACRNLATADRIDDMMSAIRQAHADRDRPAAALEVRLQLRLQGHAVGPDVQEAAQAGHPLPAVPVHLDHQQLPASLPGLLGGCRISARDDRPRRDEPAHQRRQEARQQLLRHPRRRAVHAPAADRDPRSPPGLLLPDLHQRPADHRQDGRRSCAASATPRR